MALEGLLRNTNDAYHSFIFKAAKRPLKSLIAMKRHACIWKINRRITLTFILSSFVEIIHSLYIWCRHDWFGRPEVKRRGKSQSFTALWRLNDHVGLIMLAKLVALPLILCLLQPWIALDITHENCQLTLTMCSRGAAGEIWPHDGR